jgi:chemotaxis signal transduction protein
MTECGQHLEALALIQGRRGNDLAVLLNLFDETLPLLEAADREVVILVSDGTHKIGLVVDHASEMRDLAPQPLDEFSGGCPLHLAGDLVEGIGVQGGRVTVVIEGSRLFGAAHAEPKARVAS